VSFSALTLLVGHQEKHPACKNWVMKCCCGYLSEAGCRLFAYGPADATSVPKARHLVSFESRLVSLSGTSLPRLSWKKRPLNGCSSSSTLKQRVFQHIIVQYREFYLTCKDVCTLFWCIEWDRAMSKVFKVLVTDYVGFTNYWYIGSVIHYEP